MWHSHFDTSSRRLEIHFGITEPPPAVFGIDLPRHFIWTDAEPMYQRGTAPVTHPRECGENQTIKHFLVLGKSSVRLLASRDLQAGPQLGPQAQGFWGKDVSLVRDRITHYLTVGKKLIREAFG